MELIKIAENFCSGEKITDISEISSGHINRTYLVSCQNSKTVLQKINKAVFTRPTDVMSNIAVVTEFIRNKLKSEGGDYENGTPVFLEHDGKNYYVDDCNEYWRAYKYIDGDCYQFCDSTDLFTRVGRAFGNFQRQLADFDASVLKETISDFHNTAWRYRTFEKQVAADTVKRAHGVQKEIAFVRERREACSYIVDGIAEGKFPLRVTHNDTKLNNIIMNKTTGEGLCVIDLDTVMPGSMLYDFGDAIRFGASSAAEDETDSEKIFIKTDMFEAFALGFIDGLGGSATKEEILAFPQSARIITLETGMRFLTDYLAGDTYFRIEYPTHNLDRARNQFLLVEDIERKLPELSAIIEKFI